MRLLPENPRRDRLLIIYLCFFVSGLAGLIYEILWNKYLALFIGSTGRAHVMTLAVFMGGLAAGSAVFGRRADRVRNPLKLYILLEFGVGVFGVAYPFLFGPYRNGFIALARVFGLDTGSSGLMAAKLVFCALTILGPTFLMGGTLPVLGRFLVREMAEVGPRVATLYYVNTFGAFFGCLLAGFLMIPLYGLRLSMLFAAALNFGVCILASLLFQEKYRVAWAAGKTVADGAAHPPTHSEAEDVLYTPAMRSMVLATIGVSGFVAMLYEITWIRTLTLVIGASTYSFSLMVAAFIFGIGLGSFLLSLKRRQSGYDVIYGVAELALGLAVLATLPLVERVPFWFNQLATLFQRAPFAFGPYMLSQMLVCFLLMLVPTVLLGLTLPAASRVATDTARRVGSRVGTVYALNTVGTLLGAGVAGLVLLPRIGLKHTFEVGVVLNLACGLAVLWLLPGRRTRRVRLAAAVVSVALFGAYLTGFPRWDKNILSSGVFRQRGRFHSFQAMLDMLAKRDKMLYYKDGIDASIAVVQSGETRSLLINGKADASDTGDMSTQILISHFPLLTRPDSKQVLVIGMGSGVSVGSALCYPVDHVDVAEISQEVVEAATHEFTAANFHFDKDKRVSIHVEDAKTFLLLTPTVYDVIISEPTNPWIAGVAGLFSKEFFETCKEKLAPDGLVVQWIHVYEIQDAALMSVLRTFTDAFPYFVIWNMNRYDIAIMGSPAPFRPDFAAMERMMAKPAVARDLQRLGIEHPLALLTYQMFVNTTRRATLFDEAVVNTDFRPYLEYEAPVGFFAGSPAAAIKSLDMRAWQPRSRRLWIDEYEPTTPPTSQQFAAFYKKMTKTGSLYKALMDDWTDRWYAAHPDDPRAAEARIAARAGMLAWQVDQLRAAVKQFPDDKRLADLHANLLVRLVEKEKTQPDRLMEEAGRAIARARRMHPKRQWPYARLQIEISYRRGDMSAVLRDGAMVFPHLAAIRENEGDQKTFDLLKMICEAAIEKRHVEIARQCLDEMALILPNNLRFRHLRSAVSHMASVEKETQ